MSGMGGRLLPCQQAVQRRRALVHADDVRRQVYSPAVKKAAQLGRLGYIQMKGKGEVTDDEGTLLVNREFHALNDMVGVDRSDPLRHEFTLWYHNLSDKNVEIQFIVQDNFGQQAELAVSFDVGRKEPQTE